MKNELYLTAMGHEIKVIFTEERPILKESQELLDGCVDISNETIYIFDGLPEDRKRETLMHELVHYADVETGDPAGGQLTEGQVNRIARAIQGILADNPDLARYFSKKIKTTTLLKKLKKNGQQSEAE